MIGGPANPGAHNDLSMTQFIEKNKCKCSNQYKFQQDFQLNSPRYNMSLAAHISRCQTVFLWSLRLYCVAAFFAVYVWLPVLKKSLFFFVTNRFVCGSVSIAAIASPYLAIICHSLIMLRFIWSARLLTFVTMIVGSQTTSFG